MTSELMDQPTGRRWSAPRLLSKAGPAIGLAAVWCLFAVLKGADFYGWSNQRLMLLQTAVVGTAAIGATLVIIAGGIDLSVGSAIATGTMVLSLLLKAGLPPFIAVAGSVTIGFLMGLAMGNLVIGHFGRIAGLILGALIGYWTSAWLTVPGGIAVAAVVGVPLSLLLDRFIGRVELSPFIVTLGMWGALRGAAKGLGNNQPIYPEQTWLTDLMQLRQEGVFGVAAPGVWLMLLLAVCFAGILRYTRFGRHVYALGSNEQTARLCGVNIERMKLLIYGSAAACAAVAAILQFSYLGGTGDPTTADGYELKVIASVVIGGASLSGGEGSVLGTLLGALTMTAVENGCTKLGLDNWVQEIVTGGIIVIAVTLDRLRHRRS